MRRVRAVITALTAALVLLVIVASAHASTLNSATLFRYPWVAGETRTRTQGQASSLDHNGNGLTYAVDWGLAGQSKLLFAPNGGRNDEASVNAGGGDDAGFRLVGGDRLAALPKHTIGHRRSFRRGVRRCYAPATRRAACASFESASCYNAPRLAEA